MVYPVFLFIYSSVWDWYTRMTQASYSRACSTLLDIDDEFSWLINHASRDYLFSNARRAAKDEDRKRVWYTCSSSIGVCHRDKVQGKVEPCALLHTLLVYNNNFQFTFLLL
jgi:hypothetical protein